MTGLFDRSNRSNYLLIGDCAHAMRVRGQLSSGLALMQVLTTHISTAKERAERRKLSGPSWEGQGPGPGQVASATSVASSPTSGRRTDRTHLVLPSLESASASTLRTTMTNAFEDAATFARNCSLFGVLLLIGIDMVKIANNTVLGMGCVDETMLTTGDQHQHTYM